MQFLGIFDLTFDDIEYLQVEMGFVDDIEKEIQELISTIEKFSLPSTGIVWATLYAIIHRFEINE